ncbi:hypothetical protein VTN77DRAFT_8481 [Rasamsonia byssochlamydoides]|uniref:uncharacterized protein n=1 Tax=Rasamsonia byssochlamydoides TaxID=89139 RepID=UPI0037431CDC
MKAVQWAASAIAALSLLAGSYATDVDPIVIKGSHFFYKTNGTEFFIQGVAYQANPATSNSNSSYVDPLTDPVGCQRDIPLLKELNTNVVRVYAINPDEDHSECMSMLADAGIYLIADLSQPSQSINRVSPEWNTDLYSRYTSVIDSLANYTNVLGFFAGNEVTNSNLTTGASVFVKAAVRDMKAYIKQKNYRAIPVGYAADDDQYIREQISTYFDCGTDDERVDFYGLNIYEWCGNSNFVESGYADRTADFSKFDIPVFFSEYGCNTVQPREFTDVPTLFGPQMTTVWSGGIIYMYFEDVNNYGLVTLSGSSVSKLPDFTAYSSQMAKISPSLTNAADYTPTNTVNQPCPTLNASWEAATNLPPTPNQALCSCMTPTLQCVPKADLTADDVGNLLGIVCGLSNTACQGIDTNSTTGVYGMYSPCDASDRLAWAINAYYQEQNSEGNGASACDFSGSATLQKSASPTGTCVQLLNAASSSAASAASARATGGGSGGATSKGAAPGRLSWQTFGVSNAVQTGLYSVAAVAAGLLMVLL